MTTNYQILSKLKERLVEALPTYFDTTVPGTLLYPLLDKQVVIDDYDIDNLPANVSLFIVPTSEDNERDTMASDQATFGAELYCVCKGMKKADLVIQAMSYKASIENMIGHDETLCGLVDFVHVTAAQFYMGVDSVGIAKGFRLDLEFVFHKIFA